MRRFLSSIAIVILSAAAAGCKTEYVLPETGAASVTIQKSSDNDSTSVTVTFIPSENAVSFRYAIGTEEDFEKFRNGTLSSTVSEGNGSVEETFDGLEPLSTYTVFATATDERGLEGEIAVAKLSTEDPEIIFTEQYLLKNSAAFTVRFSSNYRGVTYYLGKEGEREAFLAGETENSTVNDVDEYTVNYFTLDPETDYVFYAKITDRGGNTAKVIEHPFRTNADAPDAVFEYENDFYRGEYTLTPVQGCSKIAAIVTLKGENDDIIYGRNNWKGDLLAMLQSWQNVESLGVSVSENGQPLTIEYLTPTLMLENPLEIYILIYNENGDPCGVMHYDMATPSYDSNAPEATVSVEVSDITENGATYTYTAGEGTVAFLYDTVDAEWFDEFSQSEEYYEHYLHELLFSNGKWWAYMTSPVIYVEEEAEPGARYYAVACPMNCNGIQGWGELVMEEYTTLE